MRTKAERAGEWRATATKTATVVHSSLSEIQRGVVRLFGVPGIAAIFGNDDYIHDERARLEVELVRQRLDDLRIEELGFGLNGDDSAEGRGASWVMLVKTDDADRLAEILADAWRIVARHHPSLG